MVRPPRCIWGGDREIGIKGSQRKRQMVTRIRIEATSASSWAPMWDQVARIRSKFCQLQCFGKDWNRRESEGKALLGQVAEGCG